MNKRAIGAVAVAASAGVTMAVAVGVAAGTRDPDTRQVSAARQADPGHDRTPRRHRGMPRRDMFGKDKRDRTVVMTTATFGKPDSTGAARTYDAAVVPVGARVIVRSMSAQGKGGRVLLGVRGLPRTKHKFDVHVHVGACTADPEASGGHYMNDPKGGTGAANEIWLGFTANDRGAGRAHAARSWALDPARLPKSIVIHEAEGASKGKRLACVTVPFAP